MRKSGVVFGCLSLIAAVALSAVQARAQITDEAFKQSMDRYLKSREGQKQVATTVQKYFERERFGPSVDEQFESPVQAEEGKRPSKGPEDAPVVIYEYSEFECPYCKRASETMKQLLEQYPAQLRVVFKNIPLPPSFHKNATEAAYAALAAWKQGKFWEMHDALFANQNKLSPQFYEEKATELGLNIEQFKKDMQSEEVKKIVADDQKQAQELGIQGTPGFLVKGPRGGVVLKGAQPIDKFKEVIDRWLEEVKTGKKSEPKGEAE